MARKQANGQTKLNLKTRRSIDMGGKTGTTSSATTIPPEVLARYNSVNTRAEGVAAKPFQQYGTTPEQFVAPLNEQQKTGQVGMNQYANAAQPSIAYAQQGFTPQGFGQGVKGYMNPYLESAVASTRNQMQNVAGQQQAQMKGSAIGQGAFGGDRANIGMGNLINQQNLALGQTIGGMESQGFQNAAQNYMGGLGQIGQLGLQGQQAGLQGSQAQIGAGTLGQQTEQAGKTALYNQFLQEQAYPYQVAQFLGNIAMGTGALSGSNTTTTQPMSFFSDERLKDDIEKIGKTFDGQDIIKFRYKGEDGPKQIGLSAQNVEKHHPEAVGLAKGYKTVDYDAATKDAAKRGHFEEGGLASEGGAVGMQHIGQGFAEGGGAYDPYDPYSIYNILSRQQGFFGDIERSHVPTARGMSGGIGKHGRVPEANLPVGRLMVSEAPRIQQDDAINRMQQLSSLGDSATKYYDKYQEWKEKQAAAAKAAAEATKTTPTQQARGGLVGYATGGMPYDLDSDPKKLDIPDDTSKIKLPDAKNLPGTMQDPTMADIMKIVGMFKADGGRAGYATDGAVDDRFLPKPEQRPAAPVPTPEEEKGSPAFARTLNRIFQFEGGLNPRDTNGTPSMLGINQAAHPNIDVTKLTKSTASPIYYNEYWKPMGGDQLDPNLAHVATDTAVIAGVGRAKKLLAESGGDPEKLLQLRQEFQDGLIAQNPEKYGKYEKSWNNRVNQLRTDIGSTLDFPKDQPQAQGLAGKTSEPSEKKGGFGDLFTAENVIPVLTGLAGMASSRSPFLGSAILEGLGAGANAYMGTQKSLADIRQSEAGTKSMEFDTQRASFQQTPWGNIMWVRGPNGTAIPKAFSDFNPETDISAAPPPSGTFKILERYFGPPPSGGLAPSTSTVEEQPKTPGLVPSENITGTDISQPTLDYYDDKSAQTAATERKTKGANALVGGPGADIPIERSKVYISGVDKMGQASRNNQSNVYEMVTNLADVAAAKGWDAPGSAYTTRTQLSAIANTIGRVLGAKEDILEGDSERQVADKLQTLAGLVAASGAGQESVRAFDELANATANPSQNPKAFAKLASMMMMQNKRSIDQLNHATRYGKDSGNSYVDAPADFERVNPYDRYVKEAKALENVMLNDPALFKDMITGKIERSSIDAMFEKAGLRGMSSYFVGGS